MPNFYLSPAPPYYYMGLYIIINNCLLNISNKHLKLKHLEYIPLTKWQLRFSISLGQNLAVILYT